MTSYALYFLAWTLGISAAGAIMGALGFPLVGTLTGADATIAAMARSGARQLGFLAFIWAPGTAAVLLYHRIYCDRQARRPG